MKIYIEIVIALVLLIIFICWKIWFYRTQRKLLKNYNPDDDKARPSRNASEESIAVNQSQTPLQIMEQELEKKKQENNQLRGQLSMTTDLINLRDTSFYRQNLLVSLERIAIALETKK